MSSQSTVFATIAVVTVICLSAAVLSASETDAEVVLVYDAGSGKLTASGTGALDSLAPYAESSIVTVEIGSGITSIAPNLFKNKTSLTSVSIPNTVESIGENAFSGCTALKAIEIPAADINSGAFNGCTHLQSITLGSGSFVANANAFAGCSAVTSVVYDGIMSSEAFLSASGFGNNVSLKITSSSFPSKILNGATKVKSVEVTGPTSIPNGVFSNTSGITSLTLSTVTSITADNMSGLTSLKELKIVKGTVAARALEHCTAVLHLDIGADVSLNDQSLAGMKSVIDVNYASTKAASRVFAATNFATNDGTSVTLTGTTVPDGLFMDATTVDSVEITSKVRSIGTNVFLNCSGLESITLEAALSGLKSSPFSGLAGQVTFIFSVQSIPANILKGVKAISSVQSKHTPNTIGEYAFADTNAEINLGSMMLKSTVIEAHAFENAKGVKTLMDINASTIGAGAFSGCTNLMNVNLSGYVTTIGDGAFSGCTSLSSLILGPRVTKIGDGAFSGCSAITSISYGCLNATSASRAFVGAGSGSTELTVVKSVVSLPAEVFSGFGGKVKLPNTLEIINYRALEGCKLFDTDMEEMTSLWGVGDQAFKGSSIEKIYIGESLTNLSPTAFEGCTEIKEIVADCLYPAVLLSDGVSKLSCIKATGATLSFGADVKEIPANIFNGATVISAVDLTDITTIGSRAFKDTSIRSIEFVESITSIGSEAFHGIEELRLVNFLNPNVSIGKNAFWVQESHLDTDLYCYRHSTAASYDWNGDHRDTYPPHYYHIDGEYDGMLEVFYLIGENTIGSSATNTLIDFFIDNVSLTVLEAIDLGSVESNTLLLVVIAIALLLLLFLFIYIDQGERVRIIEILLAVIFTFVVTECVIRRIVDYPDWYWPVAIWVGTGFVTIILGAFTSLKEGRTPGSSTLLLLYSRQFGKDLFRVALGPIKTINHRVFAGRTALKIVYIAMCFPIGIIQGAIYFAVIVLAHLPAFIFSVVLCKIFGKRGDKHDKHRDYMICPVCGGKMDHVDYKCVGSCTTIHTDLVPGKYGVHKATCANPNCRARLPCSYTVERWNPPVTPMCRVDKDTSNHHPIPKMRECDPYVFSVVGGPGSGKSFLIAAAHKALGSRVSVIDREENTKDLISDYEAGIIDRDRTTPKKPYVSYYKTKGKDVRGLYLFDTCGASFSGEASSDMGVVHYSIAEGVVLVINPAQMKDPQIQDSDYKYLPRTIVVKFKNDFELTAVPSSTPVAVVVTMAEKARYGNGDLIGASEADIRDYLISEGARDAVNILESNFKTVKYFSAGSNDDSASFAPVEWLLRNADGDRALRTKR